METSPRTDARRRARRRETDPHGRERTRAQTRTTCPKRTAEGAGTRAEAYRYEVTTKDADASRTIPRDLVHGDANMIRWTKTRAGRGKRRYARWEHNRYFLSVSSQCPLSVLSVSSQCPLRTATTGDARTRRTAGARAEPSVVAADARSRDRENPRRARRAAIEAPGRTRPSTSIDREEG